MPEIPTLEQMNDPNFVPCNAPHMAEPRCGCTLFPGHDGDEHVAHRIDYSADPMVLVELARWPREP